MNSPWANGEAAEAVSRETEKAGISSRYEQLHAFMQMLSSNRDERMHVLWAEFMFQMLTAPGVNEHNICNLMQHLLDQTLTLYREIRDE